MNKLLLMMPSMLLGISLTAFATTQIITIKEAPVELRQEGEMYVVPEGTTKKYYYYKQAETRYVCTSTQPDTLSGVAAIPLNVRIGTETSQVYCYPSTYFVVPSD